MNESNLKWMALISRTQELTLMFATIAAAFLTQTICLDDTTVKFEIWDTGTSTWTRSMNVELVSNFFLSFHPLRSRSGKISQSGANVLQVSPVSFWLYRFLPDFTIYFMRTMVDR